MENIQEELKRVILDVMLPETEAYLKELDKAIEDKTASKDEVEAKMDVEAFIDELKTIIEIIEANKISEEEAKMVFEKITTMLEEHE